MDSFIPLLPENFLVTYSDVVPGLRRFDTAGQLSVTAKQVGMTLWCSPLNMQRGILYIEPYMFIVRHGCIRVAMAA
jgi:hypothetical protein